MSAVSKGAGVAAVVAMFAHTTATVNRVENHVGKNVRSVVTAVVNQNQK